MSLGRLERVELRDQWPNEAQDFTPWLAEEENLALLGDTIGFDLELEAVEKDVGSFSADIVCKETANNSIVLIENQIEKTDHTHLGQILTYAAGLNAVTIVWVAKRFTDEHRAALDWLNEITNEDVNFFGLEVELWKIGDSAKAPKFNIASKPNEWTKAGGGIKAISSNELTAAKKLQLEFWHGFKDYAQEHAKNFRTTKPLPQHWMNIAVGRTGFKFHCIASMYNNNQQTYEVHELRVELALHGKQAKGYFAALEKIKADVEAEMGEAFEWYNPEDANVCIVMVRRDGDLEDADARKELYSWLTEKLDRMHKIFAPRIRTLKPVDIVESGTQ